MKISRKIISAVAAAILLAAPFATAEISSKFQNDGYTVEGGWEDIWKKLYPDHFQEEGQNKKCYNINNKPTASKPTPWTCKISFNDIFGKHDKKDMHCINNKNKKDHTVWITNTSNKTKSASAKCGKKATAYVSCKWKTKLSQVIADWEYRDGYNNYHKVDNEKCSTLK